MLGLYPRTDPRICGPGPREAVVAESEVGLGLVLVLVLVARGFCRRHAQPFVN